VNSRVLYQPRQTVQQQLSEIESLLPDVQNLIDRLVSALFHVGPIAMTSWTAELL
jgi:hypothetical protein